MAALGTVLYRLKRLEDAENVLASTVNSGKADSDAAYILARVKAERGHPDEAMILLKKALDAPGLFVARAEAREWLDRVSKPSK